MRRRRRFAAVLFGLGAVLFVVLVAGGVGATAAVPTPAPNQQGQPPGRDHTPFPIYTVPPAILQTAPPVASAAPTVVPTPTPPPTAVPTTGPAVGTEVTPPGLVSVPVASLGPAPQAGGSDPTLIVLVVIIGLGLLAIGAFVLALSVQ